MSKPTNHKHTAHGSFLPTEYVKNKSQVRANFVALLLFTLVMAGVIGAFVVNHQRWRDVRVESETITALFTEEASKIEQLKGLEAQRADLLDRAEVVTALIDRVPRSVLMAEIVRDMPAGITLTLVGLEGERVRPPTAAPDPKDKSKGKTRSLTTKADDTKKPEAAPKVLPPRFRHTVTVEGLAEKNEEIANYVLSLRSSELFTEVELPLVTSSIVDQVGYRRFKITMRLPEKADARQVAGVEQFTLDRAAFGLAEDAIPPGGPTAPPDAGSPRAGVSTD
jgi:Tfp pilus assembly protein PilN